MEEAAAAGAAGAAAYERAHLSKTARFELQVFPRFSFLPSLFPLLFSLFSFSVPSLPVSRSLAGLGSG